MTEAVKKIADDADMIVNGYSFKQRGEYIHVLNLNCPDKATVLGPQGDAVETSMDDIEIRIVQEYLAKNRRFLGA